MTTYFKDVQSALDMQSKAGDPEPTDAVYLSVKENLALTSKVPEILKSAWDDGPRKIWSDFQAEAASISGMVMSDKKLQDPTWTPKTIITTHAWSWVKPDRVTTLTDRGTSGTMIWSDDVVVSQKVPDPTEMNQPPWPRTAVYAVQSTPPEKTIVNTVVVIASPPQPSPVIVTVQTTVIETLVPKPEQTTTEPKAQSEGNRIGKDVAIVGTALAGILVAIALL